MMRASEFAGSEQTRVASKGHVSFVGPTFLTESRGSIIGRARLHTERLTDQTDTLGCRQSGL